MEVGPIVEYAANYGFPALFAVLFWSYITKIQSTQNDRLRDIEASLTRMEDMMFLEELNRSRSRSRDEEEP